MSIDVPKGFECGHFEGGQMYISRRDSTDVLLRVIATHPIPAGEKDPLRYVAEDLSKNQREVSRRRGRKFPPNRWRRFGPNSLYGFDLSWGGPYLGGFLLVGRVFCSIELVQRQPNPVEADRKAMEKALATVRPASIAERLQRLPGAVPR